MAKPPKITVTTGPATPSALIAAALLAPLVAEMILRDTKQQADKPHIRETAMERNHAI